MSQELQKDIASVRLASLFDDGYFVEIDAGNNGGARAGYGSVGGATVFAFCQTATEDDGVVGRMQARKFAKVYELAAKTGSPVITIYDSKGVRIDDGFKALKSASKMLRRVSELSGVVPQIAVVLGPCGGTMALCAAMADFCIMAKSGELFLTPAFTDKAKGGRIADVGSMSYALKSGVAALGCETETEALAAAAKLAGLLPLNNLSALPVTDFAEPAYDPDECPIYNVADSESVLLLFTEMGGGARTTMATIGGTPCGLIATRGELCREDTAKMARLIEICDAFNLPVITFINTPGFLKSADNDVHEGIRSAARLAHVLAETTSAKISVINGEAIGAAYSVFCGQNAGCDLSYAWPDAVISPLAPKAAAALLWEDRITESGDLETLGAEYAATVASAQKAAEAGAIDAVIAPESTRIQLISALDLLSAKRVSRLPKKHGNMPL